MEALAAKSTKKKNTDVLLHILDFLKESTTKEQRADLVEVIENYRLGVHPLIVPVTLLNHYITVYDIPYIQDQFYLNPHPMELSLRNH